VYIQIGCENQIRATFSARPAAGQVRLSVLCCRNDILTWCFVDSDIRTVMDTIYDKGLELRNEKLTAKKEVENKLNYTEQQLTLLTQEMKDKIHHMVEDVEQRVSKDSVDVRKSLHGAYNKSIELPNIRQLIIFIWAMN
jgi:hypothetical protein